MDGLIFIIGIGVLLSIIVTPILCLHLLSRIRNLEKRLEKTADKNPAPRSPGTEQATPAPTPVRTSSAMGEAKRRSRGEHTDKEPAANESSSPARGATPPPLPDEPKREPATAPSDRVTAPPTCAAESQESWMARLGMLPPSTEDKESNLIAWWSTRIGLALGVIAAVFFGMYINKNTVPWVRLLELALVAVALFGAGWGLERKLAAFGRALSAGGLALLYVAAYAAYGLPAMKVIESPLVGTLVQAIVIGLTIAWALLRAREAVFGLALVLGYVTCWFSAREGLAPIPLISLLVLGAAGTGMFAWRAWWSGITGALAGSGGGLILLAASLWRNDSGGPAEWLGLGSALLLTTLYLGALGVQWKRGCDPARKLIPLATSLGVVAGLAVTWALEIEREWFYASFAVLFLAAGVWVKSAGSNPLWQTLWAKASVLIALFLIEKFGGPTRAFALLAEAAVLVVLARPKDRLVYEIGALLAAITGWSLLASDLDLAAAASLGATEGFLLAYLFGAFVVTVLHQRLLSPHAVRSGFAVALSVAIGIALSVTVLLRFEHEWALLVSFGFGVAALAVALPLRFAKVEPLLATLLLGILWWLDHATFAAGTGWQALSWLAAGWTFYGWQARAKDPVAVVASYLVLVSSLIAIAFAVDSFFGDEWIGVALVATAALWLGIGARIELPRLCYPSLLPHLLGGLGLAGSPSLSASPKSPEDALLVGGLLAAAAAWICGWLARGQMKIAWPSLFLRTGVLVYAITLVLNAKCSEPALIIGAAALSLAAIALWLRMDDLSLPWAGLVLALYSGFHLLDDTDNGAWHETGVVLLALICAANGLLLGRSRRSAVLATPKVASLLWGSAGMAAVLFGFAQRDQAAGWTTAAWAAGAVALLVTGFWGGFRGYRIVALIGLGFAILRLFLVDIQDSLWRIIAFGVTGGLLVGIGYLYHRFHQRLADGDLDWGGKDNEGATAVAPDPSGEASGPAS